jgi:hypothetical protein
MTHVSSGRWRGFVNRLMAMSVAIAGRDVPVRIVDTIVRNPRVPERPKPAIMGMATEWERNIKPPTKGRGTRKQRKEANRRAMRSDLNWSCVFRFEWYHRNRKNESLIRYGSKAHRRALAKLTQ